MNCRVVYIEKQNVLKSRSKMNRKNQVGQFCQQIQLFQSKKEACIQYLNKMNDYQISKLRKELAHKQQLLIEEQEDRVHTEKQLVLVQAERDKYHSELLIARQQIENIEEIIANNVKAMKDKLEKENSAALNELRQLKDKVVEEKMLNERMVEENRNKDATITELSARLKEMSRKYKDTSMLVNTKEISEQTMITHNQFYKLTEKYNKICKDMENIMAENKILRKLHGVPDNFGFDLEEIKIAEKQELEDYKAQCRKLETEIEELEGERTQLRYRLRQYNTLYSNKGERYKDMTQQQLELLDSYALNLKEGKVELPQIDKSKKEMEKEIVKLRGQVEVLQNKASGPMIGIGGRSGGSSSTDDSKVSQDQMRRFQEQIKSMLEPFVQDIKKLSETNINSLVQNIQNISQYQGSNVMLNGDQNPDSGFKGPIPLPVAHNDWSKIKEGYSFIYSSKIPVDMKNLDSDISFEVLKARYEVAALQLQNIESLKLLKEKNKIEAQISKELFDLKDKYKKCLKVQDELFVRYFKEKSAVSQKVKKLQIEKHTLINEKEQAETKLEIVSKAYEQTQKKGDTEKRLAEYTSRLAIAESEVLKLQRKYDIIHQEQASLREAYTNLETKTIKTEYSIKEKLFIARNNEAQLTSLCNQILEDSKQSVSGDVHNTLLARMQLINDKSASHIQKQTELRLRIEKLESLERDASVKDEIVENLREDNLDLLLELQVIRARLRSIDVDYRLFVDTFERLIQFVNTNNISLMSYFKKFDNDGSGELSKLEFESALKALGFKCEKGELDILFSEFDLDGSGSVSYKEFLRKMRRGGALSRTKEEEAVLRLFNAIKHSKLSIRKAFEIIDADGSNAISKAEMQSALSKIGIKTSAQSVDFLFKMCDSDGDNSISCSELEKLYNEMIRESEVMDKEVYDQEIDWKLAFILKLEECSLRFNSSLSETFKALDDDGNSVLTMTQLVDFIKKAELTIDRSSIQQLFNFLDRRRDGKVEFGEFLKVLAEAKAETKRIERIKYIKQRTLKLKQEAHREMLQSKNMGDSIGQSGEVEKLKIRLSALDTKHTNLIKKYERLSKELATREQDITELKKTVEDEEKSKIKIQEEYHQEKLSNITLKTLNEKSIPEQEAALIRKELNELKVKIVDTETNLDLYKGLYEGLTDKSRGEEMRLGKIESERNKYYDIVKDLQGQSDSNAQIGKLNIQLQYSKRNEETINTKYDRVISDLRKIDEENHKLIKQSSEKEKEIINTHVFFQNKSSEQQRTIDDLTLKILPTVSMDKMDDYLVKLREISNSKSGLEQENRMLREKNFNLQVRNDYIENEKVHIEELERKLRSLHSDEASKSIIDLTKKLSDYKMTELKAKRELSLMREKEEYYMRVNNTHSDNIKELQEELSNWESKFSQREEFWRKRLNEQMKLMEEFQKEATRVREEQQQAVNYFNNRREEQAVITRKYQGLSEENYNNVSQFVEGGRAGKVAGGMPIGGGSNDDEYTEKLLEKISALEQELMLKEKEIHELKTAIKDIMPEANIHKNLSDFGGQMSASTNSFVLQTDLSGSQLKSNARRFLNNQKDIENYYKEENARITMAAQQSVDTLQRIIDDKNDQIKKKERVIQDLKKEFMKSKDEDCLEIQKLNEELRDLRSKSEMGNINELMARTTNRNFYQGGNNRTESKTEEYLKAIDNKDQQIRDLQDKYDRLLISKNKNSKVGSSTTSNGFGVSQQQSSQLIQRKLDELMIEREHEKRKYQENEKKLEATIGKLNNLNKVQAKKIEHLNAALMEIKNDIVSEKNMVNSVEAEQFMEEMLKTGGVIANGGSKNDAQLEQYLQQAMMKIKDLKGQNSDLRGQLEKAKDTMSKTSNKFGRR